METKKYLFETLWKQFLTEQPLIMEQVNKTTFIDTFNKVIVPWMTDKQTKWTSQGFTCRNAGGDEQCDNNLYGFKLLDDSGVEKYKYDYYFPHENGVHLKLIETESGEIYFHVYSENKSIGIFGKDYKTPADINKSATEAITSFENWASSAYSDIWPK
jgi:hypothetical protein